MYACVCCVKLRWSLWLRHYIIIATAQCPNALTHLSGVCVVLKLLHVYTLYIQKNYIVYIIGIDEHTIVQLQQAACWPIEQTYFAIGVFFHEVFWWHIVGIYSSGQRDWIACG